MAAVALFLLAVAGYALLVHASPQYYWTQIDTAVYRDGGIAVRNQSAMLYALELGAAKLPFTYTPFAALVFFPWDSPGGPAAWPGRRRHSLSPRWASGSNRLR